MIRSPNDYPPKWRRSLPARRTGWLLRPCRGPATRFAPSYENATLAFKFHASERSPLNNDRRHGTTLHCHVPQSAHFGIDGTTFTRAAPRAVAEARPRRLTTSRGLTRARSSASSPHCDICCDISSGLLAGGRHSRDANRGEYQRRNGVRHGLHIAGRAVPSRPRRAGRAKWRSSGVKDGLARSLLGCLVTSAAMKDGGVSSRSTGSL